MQTGTVEAITQYDGETQHRGFGSIEHLDTIVEAAALYVMDDISHDQMGLLEDFYQKFLSKIEIWEAEKIRHCVLGESKKTVKHTKSITFKTDTARCISSGTATITIKLIWRA